MSKIIIIRIMAAMAALIVLALYIMFLIAMPAVCISITVLSAIGVLLALGIEKLANRYKEL